MVVPLGVFFALERYFVRGLPTGPAKGQGDLEILLKDKNVLRKSFF
jgi:hypothetical protein